MSAKSDLPGGFEQLVMLAVARLGDSAYGMAVRKEIEARTARKVSLGAVYSTLERLEAKGYVTSKQKPGGEEREGRARRFFRMSAAGVRALNEGIAALDRMREGVSAVRTPARAT